MMARPRITLTDDEVREVETLAALLNQDQIADYFGIARNTFRAICERDEEVLARYKKGKAKAIAHVANGLLQRARAGDTTSSIFYLKTQAGWRETANLEHQASPEVTKIVRSIVDPREKIEARLNQIAERMQIEKCAEVGSS
jgi:DNA-binding CsgD family transcriptional regulator